MPSDPLTQVYERVASLTVGHSTVLELVPRSQPSFTDSSRVSVGGGVHPQFKDPSPGSPRLLLYPSTSQLRMQDGGTHKLAFALDIAIDSASVMLDVEVFPIQWALLTRLKALSRELVGFTVTSGGSTVRVDSVTVDAVTASLEDLSSGKHLGWSCVHRIVVQCSM